MCVFSFRPFVFIIHCLAAGVDHDVVVVVAVVHRPTLILCFLLSINSFWEHRSLAIKIRPIFVCAMERTMH